MQELPELVRWATAIVRMLAPHAANHQALREALPTLLVLLHRDDATVRENAAASLTFVMRRCEPSVNAFVAPCGPLPFHAFSAASCSRRALLRLGRRQCNRRHHENQTESVT